MKKDADDEFVDAVIAGENPDRSFDAIILREGRPVAVKHTPKYIISGDTDSNYVDVSQRFPKSTPKEHVIAFADALAVDVNASFAPFMKAVFNSNDVQVKAISTARDIVSDKSLMYVKKNYTMHYVNKEGVDVDGYKTMGLATKRSDTPLIVKAFLTKMFDMLMDRVPMETIDTAVREFKVAYHAASFLDVGRPMSIKELQKYEKRYAETKGDMKGFSYHIRATMYYNMMCGVNDIRIVNGNKIRVVYIKHPDIRYIAVPADADVLPTFLDTLEIDWETQWAGVLKKINLYLIPLGYLFED